MSYIVLSLWAIQAAVGIRLFSDWWRHGRRGPSMIATHVSSAIIGFALWAAFAVASDLWMAWSAFAVITVGNVFGDMMLVRRHRRVDGPTASYASAIGAVFTRRMPPTVTFHALFSAAVYFSCLGVCIGATLASQ